MSDKRVPYDPVQDFNDGFVFDPDDELTDPIPPDVLEALGGDPEDLADEGFLSPEEEKELGFPEEEVFIDEDDLPYVENTFVTQGGPDLGNFGHTGRPGEVGGSGGGGASTRDGSREGKQQMPSMSPPTEKELRSMDMGEKRARYEKHRKMATEFTTRYVNSGTPERVKKVVESFGVDMNKETIGDKDISRNTAMSPEELHSDAKRAEPVLRNIVDGAAAGIYGTKPYYGPGGAFAVKTLESIKNKVEMRGKDVQEIGDAVRGTVVVKNVNDADEAVASICQKIQESGGRITQVDDKFAHAHRTGYVGIHINLEIITPDGKTVAAEIQVHDGEHDLIQSVHEIYDISKTKEEITDEELLRRKREWLVFEGMDICSKFFERENEQSTVK